MQHEAPRTLDKVDNGGGGGGNKRGAMPCVKIAWASKHEAEIKGIVRLSWRQAVAAREDAGQALEHALSWPGPAGTAGKDEKSVRPRSSGVQAVVACQGRGGAGAWTS